MRISFFSFLLVGALVAVRGFAKTLRESELTTVAKYDFVVSIPDVHGDLEVLLRALWMAKQEVDGPEAAGDFEAFKSIFAAAVEEKPFQALEAQKRVLMIQTGDIIDRGAQSLSCYRALWQVEHVLGWDIVNLIGNHEVMTMAGQADHYAHPGDVEEFGSMKARRAAFSPGGRVWKKITDHYLFMTKVHLGEQEAALFVHAGLHPKWVAKLNKDITDVSGLNDFLTAELKRNPSSHILSSSSSPIWTRDLAQDADSNVCPRLLKQVLDLFGVTRIIVGHTPQEALKSTPRCDAKLILADVAMSRWMGSGRDGNPAALIFTLSDDGRILERIHNVYWRANQLTDQPIYEATPGETASEVFHEL